MEIALNVESKRKTATAVAFRDGQRSFGEEALNIGVKFPNLSYKYFLDLVGKKLDHPSVKEYLQKFPYYNLEEDPIRGTVVFRHNETTTYSPEELIGMLLSHATFIAERFSGQRVKDAVVTVPPYFSQSERRAVMDAASMANINVLQLFNEHMAVALNYGMFRRKELNATAKNIMFYNMGASSSWATIVSFGIVKTKERGFSETHPQAQVLGLGFDRTLGGLDLQLSVQDMIVEKFSKVKKTKRDPKDVPRAMGKIFKEAGKVKLVLSANKDYTAQIENVLDDEDLRIPFTRDEFEAANTKTFERITGPIKMALKTAGMSMSEIGQVILFGGSTRVPKIQEILTEYLQQELGKSLNTDEAAAMGAVYKAADLSTGFRVKKFITRDAVMFPIDVDFKRDVVDDDGQASVKIVKRALFGLMNNYPQKKIMTFNKFTDDFDFQVNINNLEHLPERELKYLVGLNLTQNLVKEVAQAFEKNKGDDIESKGIKAHFNMDDSGLLTIESTEAVFEKNLTVEMQIEAEKEEAAKEEAAEKAKESEEAWAKLGDKISSFWGDSSDKKEGEKEEGEKKESDKKEADKKDKKDQKDKKDKKKKEEPKKPIITLIKEPLKLEAETVDLKVLGEEQLTEGKTKLQAWADHDKALAERANAFNDLESFVVDIQSKLGEELYEKSSTEEEREKIMAKCSELSDWLYDEYTDETELSVLQDKLKGLKELTAGLTMRIREQHDRPEAMSALKSMLNTSNHFYGKAVNSTSVVDGFFTQEELDALGKLLNETTAWIADADKKIEEQPMYEMPEITANKVAEKGIALDREVKYLVNKAKIAKRKAAEDAAAAEKAKAKEEKAKKSNATEEGKITIDSSLQLL